MAYQVLDISGDVGLRLRAESLEGLFQSALEGLFSLITERKAIEERKAVEVSAQGESTEGLLVALLNECIFQFDTYGFVARRAELKELSEGRARAVLWGEEFDPGRHPRGLLVKAATYHNLDIRKTDGLWEAEVIFDI